MKARSHATLDITKPTMGELPSLLQTIAPCVVYGLYDPLKDELFYIGLTTDMVERYIQHLKCKEEENLAKYQRIHEIKSKGVLPGMHAIAFAETREEGLQLEALTIELFRIFKQPLTNQHLHMYTFSEEYKHMLEAAERWTHTKPHWFHRLRARLLGVNGYKRSLVIVLRKVKLQITITQSAKWK